MKLKLLFITAVIVASGGCSSSPPENDASNVPAWAKQASRTVDAGYIVYVGVGEDHAPERASFKAEAAAVEDLANECSFVPKGARTEDRYDQKIGTLHRAFAKVAINFQDCEEAKSSTTPEAIRKLASVQYTEELKRYQDLVDHPEDPNEEEETEVVQNGTTTNNSGVNGAVYNRYPPVYVVGSPTQFYVVRQQVVYMKQDVILSPPAAYPPQAPQTLALTQHITAASTQVHNYAVANPQIAKSPQSYSNYKQQARSQQFNKSMNRGGNRNQNAKGSNSGKSRSGGGSGRRRRRWNQ